MKEPEWLHQAASTINPSIYDRRRYLYIRSLCTRLTYPNQLYSQFFKSKNFQTPDCDLQVLIYCINHIYYSLAILATKRL